jgi:hypothetical protein
MRFSKSAISRILVVAAVAALAASCGGNSNKIDTSGPGANAGDNTRVSTIPEPPAPDTAALTPGNTVVVIDQGIWNDYQGYLTRVGRIGNGFYAITEDGVGGASWSCPDALCGMSYNGKELAMKQCQESNPGKTCIIFAKDNHPQVRYQIAP